MTDEELQNVWDKNLISAWENYGIMAHVCIGFARDAALHLLTEEGNRIKDIPEFIAYLTEHKLKRWASFSGSGKEDNLSLKRDILGYIGSKYPRLSAALFSETVKNSFVLENIEHFAVKRKSNVAANKEKSKLRREVKINRLQGQKYSVAVGGAKPSDWDIVSTKSKFGQKRMTK